MLMPIAIRHPARVLLRQERRVARRGIERREPFRVIDRQVAALPDQVFAVGGEAVIAHDGEAEYVSTDFVVVGCVLVDVAEAVGGDGGWVFAVESEDAVHGYVAEVFETELGG